MARYKSCPSWHRSCIARSLKIWLLQMILDATEKHQNLQSRIRIWFTSSPRSSEYLPSEFGRPSGPWPNFKLGVLGMFTGAFGCLNIWWWSGQQKKPNAEIPGDRSWTAGIVWTLPWIQLSFHQQVIMTACPLTFTMQAMLSPQKLPLLLPQMDTLITWTLMTFDHMSR